jgi:hypothetical protein
MGWKTLSLAVPAVNHPLIERVPPHYSTPIETLLVAPSSIPPSFGVTFADNPVQRARRIRPEASSSSQVSPIEKRILECSFVEGGASWQSRVFLWVVPEKGGAWVETWDLMYTPNTARLHSVRIDASGALPWELSTYWTVDGTWTWRDAKGGMRPACMVYVLYQILSHDPVTSLSIAPVYF